MRAIKRLGIFVIGATATVTAVSALAHSKERATVSAVKDRNGDFVVAGGCVVRARAYTEPTVFPGQASLYDLEIVRGPKDSYRWDLTPWNENEPSDHFVGIRGKTSSAPYGSRRTATIRAALHQYDIHEERVTFRNLELGPPVHSGVGALVAEPSLWPGGTPLYLLLKRPVTATTPGGITVTLPVQGADTLEKVFTGAFSMLGNDQYRTLYLQINTSPNQRRVLLPNSRLGKKHGKSVRVALACPEPTYLAYSAADNTFKILAIGIPNRNLKIGATRLDTLTLVIRQRVDLKTIPVSLEVPISRNTR